jgi:hypothetical protein
MPAVPLKGQQHEDWQALLASVAEKKGGAPKRSFLLRLLPLALALLVAVCSAYFVNPRIRTWGHCWDDPALWDCSTVEPVECRFVPAPITKNLVVKEPDKIICPVARGRN